MFDLFLTFILNLFESLVKILKNEPKQIDYDKKPTPLKIEKLTSLYDGANFFKERKQTLRSQNNNNHKTNKDKNKIL